MKTIAKLMALCLMLGTLSFAQAGADKGKAGDDTKKTTDTGKGKGKGKTKGGKKGAKKGAKKAAAADTKGDDKGGKK